MGLKAAELHGNMSQLDRMDSLKAFRERRADYLLCTDVAARGIDIQGVETVINIEFPTNIKTYIHRVGRTARAGCNGHAVTLVGEQRKKLLKTLVSSSSSSSSNTMKIRMIHPEFVEWCNEQFMDMKQYCKRIISEEQSEREMRLSNILINKSQNMIKHAREIFNKPSKEWHMSVKDKQKIKQDAHLDDLGDDFANQVKEKIDKKIEEKMLRKKQLESGLSIKEIKEKEKKQFEQMSKLDKERFQKKQNAKKEQQQRKKELTLSKKLAGQAMAEQRKARSIAKEEKNRMPKSASKNKNRTYLQHTKVVDRLGRESSRELKKLHNTTNQKEQSIKKKCFKKIQRKRNLPTEESRRGFFFCLI